MQGRYRHVLSTLFNSPLSFTVVTSPVTAAVTFITAAIHDVIVVVAFDVTVVPGVNSAAICPLDPLYFMIISLYNVLNEI
jgi:hypothetical protein